MITEKQWEKVVADGRVKPEELESEKAARAAETEEIFNWVHTVMIQLANGQPREIGFADCNLFEGWERVEDEHYPYSDRESDWPGLIRLPYEGYHETVFLNPEALDYVSFPTHKIEEDETESFDDGLGESESDDDDGDDGKVIKLPKAKKKGRAK